MKRIIVFFTIGILLVSILSGCSKKEVSTTNVSKYRDFSTFELRSGLVVFPKSIPVHAKVNGYYYSQIIPPLIGTYYQIYLNLTLPVDEYKLEVDRLSKIKKNTKLERYEETTARDIKFDENNFIYPAYVARLGDGTSEYALLDEKNHKIIYVFLQIISKDKIRFNKKYLPKGYKNSGKSNESFNIYD